MKLESQSLINLKRKLRRFMHFGRLFSLKALPKVFGRHDPDERHQEKSLRKRIEVNLVYVTLSS